MTNWARPSSGWRSHQSRTQIGKKIAKAIQTVYVQSRSRRRRHVTAGYCIAILLLFGVSVSGQLGAPSPDPKLQFFTNAGAPCASCTLTFSVSGTATPLDAYTTSALSTPLSNPLTLDSAGRVSGSSGIFLTPGLTYRVVLKTSGGTTVWTADGITGLNGVSADRMRLSTHSVTIATGAITATYAQYGVDTESAAAADNLDTITPGTGVGTGSFLLLTPANVSRVVTVRDAVGNIQLTGGSYRLDTSASSLLLYYDGSNWIEVSRSGPGITFLTSTLTGTQNNLSLGLTGDTVLRLANATALTITGFAAGLDGQRLTLIADGAQVNLPHVSGSSSAGNQLVNMATATDTILAAPAAGALAGGSATYVYISGLSAWRLISHVQGSPVSYTPVWGNSGTANTLGNGTLTGSYIRTGRLINYQVILVWGSTTASGNGNWSFTTPSATNGFGPQAADVIYLNTGTASYIGTTTNSSTTVANLTTNASPLTSITATVPFTWGDTDAASLSGWYLEP